MLEGRKGVETALHAEAAVVEAVLLREGLAPAVAEALAAQAEHVAARCEWVAAELFDELADTVTPDGVLAVARSPERPLAALPITGLALVLDAVQDPGNVGTLLRTADAVGAAVILTTGSCDPLSPKVTRATAGSVLRVPWARATAEAARHRLAEQGLPVVVLDAAGEPLYGEPLPHPLAWVAGSEAHGPGPAWADLQRRCVPMRPGPESLNVAVATAIAVYESVRQHGLTTGDERAK